MIGAVHAAGLLWLFRPFRGAFNDAPLIDQDWGPLFHHLMSMDAFWREQGRLWGYNPLFMAGYPSNTIQDLSVKFFEIAALALTALGLTPVQGLKLAVVAANALAPWLCYWAVRNFLRPTQVTAGPPVLAAALGTLYWWNGYPREMVFYGMIGFPVACYLALFAASLIPALGQSGPRWRGRHAAWLAAVALLPAVHVEGFLLLLPVFVAVVITSDGPARHRTLLWMGTGAIVSIGVNAIWLIPALAHLRDGGPGELVRQVPLFQRNDFWAFIGDYLEPGGYFTFRASLWGNGLRAALLLAGVAGAVALYRSTARRTGVILLSGLAALYALAYFGSLVPLVSVLQPLRFKIALDLLLVVGAATALRLGRVVQLVVMAGVAAAAINIALTEIPRELPLRTTLRPAMERIVDWMRTTPPDGRVLFEESGDETGFVYDGMYLSSFLPHWTGRELIGGPLNVYNDRHHVAEFHSGLLLKQPIATLSDSRLASYLRTYNISAIVAFHPDSVKRLQGFMEIPLRFDGRMGPYHFMRVDQPLNWFIEGTGRVGARPGKLTITEARGDTLVLKYHWVAGLTATPAAEIAAFPVPDDPIPFIKVVRPPPAFTLTIE